MPTGALPPLSVAYAAGTPDQALADPGVLAVLGFGGGQRSDDPRFIDVGLSAAGAPPVCEVWRGRAAVQTGRRGALRWSDDGDYGFFAIEVDEAQAGGIAAAAASAYRQIADFLPGSATPHVLRFWNYLDAINAGAGDDERYRLFCSGRADAMNGRFGPVYPAATAIGRQDGVRTLQVYGLAARAPGTVIENPRQVSAWRYPRQYGPTAPTFARGMLSPAAQLLISGTAAVVGHASQHDADLAAQLDETLANLASLHVAAGPADPALPAAASWLKAYVRDPRDAAIVDATLRARLPGLGGLLVLGGDICRSELLVEIDGIASGIR